MCGGVCNYSEDEISFILQHVRKQFTVFIAVFWTPNGRNFIRRLHRAD